MRQSICHGIHVIRQLLPSPLHILNLCLATETTFRADFAGDTSDFTRKQVEFCDHVVDSLFELIDFTAGGDSDCFGEVTSGDCCSDVCYVADLLC